METEQGFERLKAATALVDSGKEYLLTARWDDAVNSFSKAIELRPDYLPAWDERAETYLRLGLWELAAPDSARRFSGCRNQTARRRGVFRALVCAYLNEQRQYRQICASMHDRFLGSEVATSDLRFGAVGGVYA